MALTPQQILEGLQTASKGGKVTEIYNALRDFRFDLDSSKLSQMSDADLLALRRSQGAALSRKTNTPRQRKKLISDLKESSTSMLRYIARDLQNKNTTEATKDIGDWLTDVSALETAGIVSGFEDQFTKLLGDNFDPLKQAASEGQLKNSRVEQQTDGTLALVASDGTVLESGYTSAAQGQARQNELVVGSTPGITGTGEAATPAAIDASLAAQAQAAAPSGDTTGVAGGYKSSALDVAGINYAGLTDEEIKNVEAAYMAAQNDPGLLEKLINDLEITDDDIESFLDTAKTEYGDYYGQQFGRGSEDFQKSLEFAAEERKTQLAQEELNKQLALESEQSGMAEAGLATSGIRQKAEERLAQQAQDIATSSRRGFEYDIFKAGRNAEDILGSKTVAGLTLPELGGASIYNPAGNIKGTLEAEQTTNEQLEAARLEKLARERRTEILAGEGGVTTL